MLAVNNIYIDYHTSQTSLFRARESVSAVRGVSFSVARGDSLAIVGESGCGKTSLAMAILGFVKPVTGRIEFEGQDLGKVSKAVWKRMRRRIQPVFQDAHNSLNPRMTVYQTLVDGLDKKIYSKPEERELEIQALLNLTGLKEEHLRRYPHQLSGGQKQRVCLARALAPRPVLLILDEPLSAQDLSIQAYLIQILLQLKQQRELTLIIISHNLRAIRPLAQRIAIMKAGRIEEYADSHTILQAARQPYTKFLLKQSGLGD